MLTKASTGTIGRVRFTYDPFAISERISETPETIISLAGQEWTKPSRGIPILRPVTLQLQFIVKAPPNFDEAFLEAHIESFDLAVEALIADGKVRTVEQFERFGFDQIQNQQRLLMQATITLPNLEARRRRWL